MDVNASAATVHDRISPASHAPASQDMQGYWDRRWSRAIDAAIDDFSGCRYWPGASNSFIATVFNYVSPPFRPTDDQYAAWGIAPQIRKGIFGRAC
jgi:hypothetical protein